MACQLQTVAAAAAALVGAWGGTSERVDAAPAAPGAEDGVAAPSARSLEAVASCAVSLAFLTDFFERCVAPLPDGHALTTKQVVDAVIVPVTHAASCCAFTALVPRAVGAPQAFASHAFGNAFSLLVSALRARFADAVPAEVFIWVDIFAINQHQPGADLHEGRALARTIEISAETLVVLDRRALPLSRLWCLYEMGSTPAAKLVLLTPGASEADLAAAFRAIDVEAAQCFDSRDTARIREHIVVQYGNLAAFQRMLRLRLLLKPTSYEGDRASLLKPAAAAAEPWRFDALLAFLAGEAQTWPDTEQPQTRRCCCFARSGAAAPPPPGGALRPNAPRLACVVAGPGAGKSTLSAALCAARAAKSAAGVVHAHHFFKASDVRRQDVGAVVRSLAYQLALAFPLFADALLALQPAEAEVALSDPSRGTELLLTQPLRALGAAGAPRVTLLFDALDEAEVASSGDAGERAAATALSVSRALRLILDLGLQTGAEDGALASLPLSVVVTTRPEPHILDALRGCWRDALAVFPPEALRAADSGARHARQPRLLAQLRAALRNQGSAAAPGSVDAAYASFFRAASPLSPGVRRLLALLLAARQPPSLALLEGLHARDACAALPGWDLLFQERQHCVHMLHKSLAEWLADAARSGRFAADVAAGHAAWAEHLSAQLRAWLDAPSPSPPPPPGSYVYAHALAHLDAAGRGEEARALLLRLPWLQATLRERGAHALMADVAARKRDCPPLLLLYRCLVFVVGALLRPDAAEELPGALVGRLLMVPSDHGWVEAEPGSAASRGVARLYAEAFRWRGPRAWLRVVGLTQRNPVGPLQMRLDGHRAEVTCLAAMPDGATVVSGAADGALRVWNVARSECVLALREEPAGRQQQHALRCVAALPGGRAAAGGDTPCVTLWNIVTGEREAELRVTDAADGSPVATTALLALAPRGRRRGTQLVQLLAGGADGALRLLDCSAAGRRCATRATLRGHEQAVSALAQLPTQRLVASASLDGSLRVWDVRRARCVRELRASSPARCLAALPDGRLAAGHDDARIRLWLPRRRAVDDAATELRGHAAAVTSLGVLPDGWRLVSGSDDGTLLVWEGASTSWRMLTGPEGTTAPAPPPPPGARAAGDRDFSATCLAVLPGGGHVASGHRDRSLRTWDADTAEVDHPAPLSKHVKLVTCLAALPPEGATLRVASGARDGAVRLWDASRGRCVRTLEGHAPGKDVTLLVLLADGQRLLSGSDDGTLRLWALDGGGCLQVAARDGADGAALLRLPRAPPPPPLPAAAAAFAAGLRAETFFLQAPGCTRTMLGNGASETLCLARPGGGVRVVVRADRWVHYFSVMPAAGADTGPDGRACDEGDANAA